MQGSFKAAIQRIISRGSGRGGRSRPRQPPPRGVAFWDDVYLGAPPWDTGRPQAPIAELADSGGLVSPVLDVGCGTGEHALLAAAHGCEALGVDLAPRAIEIATRKARERGLQARFVVADALHLVRLGESYMTVIDNGLFHTFADDSRGDYVASLGSVVPQNGRVYLMCFSELQPATLGPRRVTPGRAAPGLRRGLERGVDRGEPV